MTVNEVPVEIQHFIFEIVMSLVVAIIVPFLAMQLAKIARDVVAYVKNHTDKQTEVMLETIIGIAVRAAEQAGVDRLIKEGYSDKKSYAISVVQAYLRARGLGTLADNVEELAARIEEAILLGLQESGQPEPSG